MVFVLINGEAIYRLLKQKLRPDSTRDTTREEIARNEDAERDELYRLFRNDWLYYPRLGIEAPIQWEVPQDQADDYLPHGLVHVLGTATPDINGDILITGHSSYYWWVEGDYKTILASLTEAQAGDVIVMRKGKIYFYEVSDIKEVSGEQALDFVTMGKDKGDLYLVTCVPIGTDLRRLIVTAGFKKEI